MTSGTPASPSDSPIPADWLVPEWPAPAGVRAIFTSRNGGFSAPPRASMNLGEHVGDDIQAVQANRQRLAQVAPHPVFLDQVHGWRVLRLDGSQGTFSPPTQADASMTSAPHTACIVMVADCLPVLLARCDGSAVAAAHAGWRGLLGQDGFGVIEAAVNALRPSEAGDANLLAWLGPCIGPAAFEVGDEVYDAFFRARAQAAACFAPASSSGKWLCNLPALARQRLQALGVHRIFGNDGSRRWCTFANPQRFYSHRRDVRLYGTSGRHAAAIWLEKETASDSEHCG